MSESVVDPTMPSSGCDSGVSASQDLSAPRQEVRVQGSPSDQLGYGGDRQVATPGSPPNFTIPTLRGWSAEKFYNYHEQVIDYEDLKRLNESINEARMGLFRVTDTINYYDREERRLKVIYDRAWRRAYIESNGRTDKERQYRADMVCESMEDDWIVASQLKAELIKVSQTIRMELETLQSIGNNLRQQMKM